MGWLPKKSVVAPVDFSDQSLAAVSTALDFVTSPKDLHVIHVLPVLSPIEPGMGWETMSDERWIGSAMESLKGHFSDPKFAGIHLHAVVGDAGHEIADFAAEVAAELVIMPSHGRTGIPRILLGSVAERVVRLSHCPVLVLRS